MCKCALHVIRTCQCTGGVGQCGPILLIVGTGRFAPLFLVLSDWEVPLGGTGAVVHIEVASMFSRGGETDTQAHLNNRAPNGPLAPEQEKYGVCVLPH